LLILPSSKDLSLSVMVLELNLDTSTALLSEMLDTV
ncbi:MAG: hypothetical protein RLZ87_26, partial [Armatimonadota bacterium]